MLKVTPVAVELNIFIYLKKLFPFAFPYIASCEFTQHTVLSEQQYVGQ
jgi:hypothetical protein